MFRIPGLKEYPEIGVVHYRKSNKAKRVVLRIKPDATVIVSIPQTASFKKAEAFMLSKKRWILSTLLSLKESAPKKETYTEDRDYITRFHHLRFKQTKRSDISASVRGGYITVFLPENNIPDQDNIQRLIYKGILVALKKECISHVQPRTIELATEHGLSFNKLSFRNNKTRWGSCSGNNNISLNIQLIRLPDHLIDYVILHELAHIIHKNHSSSFWDYLSILLGNNAKQTDKELKKYKLISYE